jgi:SnoaL-like polyketide cyclase
MTTDANRAALDRAIEAWNAGDLDSDLDSYLELDDDGIEFHGLTPEPMGMTGLRVADGGMGVPATGREIALQGITVLRFADAKCTERWSQSDWLGLLVQLGAVPPPPA